MYPPIVSVCIYASRVWDLLGDEPFRFWPFGQAPRNPELPYATFQTVGGAPENYLSGSPDVDSWIVQVDVYADTGLSAREVAEALRDAIEEHADIIAWRGEGRDPDTQRYTYSFDVEWMLNR